MTTSSNLMGRSYTQIFLEVAKSVSIKTDTHTHTQTLSTHACMEE